MIDTYKVRRRCLIADHWREYGELVPEAHTWRLVESEVSTGTIERTLVGEAEFSEAILKYCPEMAEEIQAAVGLTSFDPNGPDLRPAEYPSNGEPDVEDAGDEDDDDEAATTPKRIQRRGRSKAPVLTSPPESLEG